MQLKDIKAVKYMQNFQKHAQKVMQKKNIITAFEKIDKKVNVAKGAPP